MSCIPYVPPSLPPRHGILATRATNLSIPNNTVTDVTLTAEVQDTDAYFAPTSATITIPSTRPGIYGITGRVTYASSSLGTTPYVQFTIAGVQYQVAIPVGSGQGTASAIVALASGDTIVMSTYQNSGGAVNVTSARLSAYLLTE